MLIGAINTVVLLSSSLGSIAVTEQNYSTLRDRGWKRIHPLFMAMVLPNMVSSNISIALGAKGYNSTVATACAGGTIGIKGMMVAAKTMALTTVDLFTDPANIQKAKAEFDQKRGPNFVYKTRLADRKPALDYRK